MIIIGLTGSIGMGKSTVAAMFADLGAAVFDADKAVHALYDEGGAAVAPIGGLYPHVVVDGAIDRPALSALVQTDPSLIPALEAIVHPLVRDARRAFLATAETAGMVLAVLDIPLLFETNQDDGLSAVVVVSAHPDIQKARVMARPVMTAAKFQLVKSRQMPDRAKRRKGDYIIETGRSLQDTRQQVQDIAADLMRRAAPVT